LTKCSCPEVSNFENFVRNNWAFGESSSLLHEIALGNDDALRERDEMLFSDLVSGSFE
jgi:hypothetical protein